MDEEIPTDDWKNIPLPLISAIKTLKRAHLNADNLTLEILKQQRNKNENIVLKIKKVTDGQQEAFDKQRRIQEQRTKYQETLLEQFQQMLDRFKIYLEEKVGGVEEKMGNLHADTNKTFEQYMNEDDTKAWVSTLIDHRLKSVNETIIRNQREMTAKTVRLNRHITIPGVIGETQCKFESMADYIVSREKEVDESLCELESRVT